MVQRARAARLGRDRTLGGSVRQETACFEILLQQFR
jgi:hypothetical protein